MIISNRNYLGLELHLDLDLELYISFPCNGIPCLFLSCLAFDWLSFPFFSFDFIPAYQIGHMYLNGLSRRVETHYTNQIDTRMEKLPDSLDLEHDFSSSGFTLLSFCPPENHFLEYL
jgi:hypothetical protein